MLDRLVCLDKQVMDLWLGSDKRLIPESQCGIFEQLDEAEDQTPWVGLVDQYSFEQDSADSLSDRVWLFASDGKGK